MTFELLTHLCFIWQSYEETELLRLVYFGGVEPSLRKEVWPFLLGHYQFGMSVTQRKEVCDRFTLASFTVYLCLWHLLRTIIFIYEFKLYLYLGIAITTDVYFYKHHHYPHWQWSNGTYKCSY